ncbi:unnamed protein product, partial [Oppiella nova]
MIISTVYLNLLGRQTWGVYLSSTIRLNNGTEMPALGLGTGGYGSGGPPQGQQMVGIIDEAIDIGYRHIDTAS